MDKDIRILNREETVKEIEKLIYYSKETLIIISPYIMLTEKLKERLTECRAKQKMIICREESILKDEKFLKKIGFLIGKAKNLHSKIYANENWVLFSSMNLYHYSIENNYESSIMIRENKLERKDFKVIEEILSNIKKY